MKWKVEYGKKCLLLFIGPKAHTFVVQLFFQEQQGCLHGSVQLGLIGGLMQILFDSDYIRK